MEKARPTRAAQRARREKRERRLRRSIVAHCAAIVVCAVILVVLATATRSQSTAEWITRHWTQPWVKVFGAISGVVAPVSVFELGCMILAVWALGSLIAAIVFAARRQGRRAVNRVLSVAVAAIAICTVYYSTAGVAYRRAEPLIPAAQSAEIDPQAVRQYFYDYVRDVEDACAKLQTAEDGGSVCPYTFDEISELLRAEFAKLDRGYFGDYTPRAKKIANGWIMSNMRIAGITFVPTGEPCVNRLMPLSEAPFTMAHEMAHTHGVMYEADANYVATYVLLASSDPYLHYCGLKEIGFYELLEYSNNGDLHAYELPDGARAMIRGDSFRSINFWGKYQTFGDIGAFFNDLYLKIVGQTDGTDGYYDPSTDGEQIGETPEGNPIYGDDVDYARIPRMIYAYYRDRA